MDHQRKSAHSSQPPQREAAGFPSWYSNTVAEISAPLQPPPVSTHRGPPVSTHRGPPVSTHRGSSLLAQYIDPVELGTGQHPYRAQAAARKAAERSSHTEPQQQSADCQPVEYTRDAQRKNVMRAVRAQMHQEQQPRAQLHHEQRPGTAIRPRSNSVDMHSGLAHCAKQQKGCAESSAESTTDLEPDLEPSAAYRRHHSEMPKRSSSDKSPVRGGARQWTPERSWDNTKVGDSNDAPTTPKECLGFTGSSARARKATPRRVRRSKWEPPAGPKACCISLEAKLVAFPPICLTY